jgi:hypothetical protein
VVTLPLSRPPSATPSSKSSTRSKTDSAYSLAAAKNATFLSMFQGKMRGALKTFKPEVNLDFINNAIAPKIATKAQELAKPLPGKGFTMNYKEVTLKLKDYIDKNWDTFTTLAFPRTAIQRRDVKPTILDIIERTINELAISWGDQRAIAELITTDKSIRQRGGADIPDITTRDPTTTQSYKELAEDVTGKLRTSLDTCTEDLSRCEQEKEKNRAAIESLTANIASLQADLRTQMANAAKSSQDLTAKLGDLDSAKASDAESTKALADATEQYKALIAESQAKLAETDTQLKETRAKIEGLTAEIEAADKKTQENEGLIADLKATIARLQPKAQAQAGGTLQTHPLLELAAAISAATSLFPK